MSFQINASYCEQLRFEQTSSRELYGLLLKAIEKMGWSLGQVTESTITAYARLSLTSFGEVIQMEIMHSQVEITSTCLMPQILSIGKNKRNIRRLGRQVAQLMQNCTDLELQQQFMTASANFISAPKGLEKDRFNNLTQTSGRFSRFISIFNPKPGYFITPILIDLNILYFVLIGLAGAGFFPYDLRGFEYLGTNSADYTLTQGQWWRLLTYQFVHTGFLHLFGNMFALLLIGAYLEPLLGKARFLIFYLICGVFGGLLSSYIHPFFASAGASGAIFGMFGVFLGLLTGNLVEKHFQKALLTTLLVFIGLQLLSGMKGAIDNSAHIGGLITGFVLGRISMTAIRKENTWKTIKRLSMITVLSGLFMVVCLKNMPNQIADFRSKLAQFNQNATMALRYLNQLDKMSDAALIPEIEYQTLGYWKQNAELLDKIDQLKIGNSGHQRVSILRNYVFMQVKKASFELLWILHNRDIHDYVDSIHHCDDLIESLEEDISTTPWTFL